MISKKHIKLGAGIAGAIALIAVYKTFNPSGNEFFPKCPFYASTGLKCPGCGSQRAVHHLLNFNIAGALWENYLLVISIPYLILGFHIEFTPNKTERILKWRKKLFGITAIYVIIVIVISFWILRNTPLLN